MDTVQLKELAYTRSGDKGDTSNIGVLAKNEECYTHLLNHLTPERVKAFFGPMVKGKVERFLLPNIMGFNFLLHDGLGGGATCTLRWDQTGKSMGQLLLRMELPKNRVKA